MVKRIHFFSKITFDIFQLYSIRNNNCASPFVHLFVSVIHIKSIIFRQHVFGCIFLTFISVIHIRKSLEPTKSRLLNNFSIRLKIGIIISPIRPNNQVFSKIMSNLCKIFMNFCYPAPNDLFLIDDLIINCWLWTTTAGWMPLSILQQQR